MIRYIYNCSTNNLKAFFSISDFTVPITCIYLYPELAAFYPRLAAEYFIYLVSEGTVLAFRNFLKSCYYAFYKCYAVI